MKIICIGRNYGKHARELGNEIPDKPVIFLKPDTALLKNNDDFYLPDFKSEIHYETEIVVKIDKAGKSILPQFAHKYYSMISLGIDFTARDLQADLKAKGLPWELAKSFDHSAVVGSFMPLTKPFSDLQFTLKKNNALVQHGRSADMLFSIDTIIAFVSSYFTLKTGDLIFTGTPEGVGPVQIGDQLIGDLDGINCFNFKVK